MAWPDHRQDGPFSSVALWVPRAPPTASPLGGTRLNGEAPILATPEVRITAPYDQRGLNVNNRAVCCVLQAPSPDAGGGKSAGAHLWGPRGKGTKVPGFLGGFFPAAIRPTRVGLGWGWSAENLLVPKPGPRPGSQGSPPAPANPQRARRCAGSPIHHVSLVFS